MRKSRANYVAHLLTQPCFRIHRASLTYWVREIPSLWKIPINSVKLYLLRKAGIGRFVYIIG